MEKIFYSNAFEKAGEFLRTITIMKRILLFVSLPAFVIALALQKIVFGLSLFLFCISILSGMIAGAVTIYRKRVGNTAKIEKFKKKYFILFKEMSLLISRPLLSGTSDVDVGNYKNQEGVPVAVYEIPYSAVNRVTLEDHIPARPETRRLESYKVLKLWTVLSYEPYIIFPSHHGREFMNYFIEVFKDKIFFTVSLKSLDAHYGNDKVTTPV